ncbi:MAG TPA: RNA polymerase sigma factor [Ktedonobacterales bacterium]|nr:RNA polymerase sigma factor [Ktedonobacterales bacterium]
MAHDQQDAYAPRRAALEARFAALPPAGTAAWWQAVERTAGPEALPYEVLARCYRARLAIAAGDTERILTAIMLRSGPSVRRWARLTAAKAPSGQRAEVATDLEQECYLKLWQELEQPEKRFIVENFGAALVRLQQHVAHDLMLKAGEWQRSGVRQPQRVPTSQTQSLQAEPATDDTVPRGATPADPHAQDELDRVDLSDLLDFVRRLPEEQRAVIEATYWQQRTQAEIAAEHGVTERTVRNWLVAALRDLRLRYRGGEEDDRG